MGEKRNHIQSVFVCVTSYQYMVSDILARKEYEKSGKQALIILKYVNGVNPTDSEYADFAVIAKSKAGKVKVGLYSFLPNPKWKQMDLYFFNDRDPISRKLAKQCRKRILIEEGVGTYFHAEGVENIGELIKPDIAYVGYPELYEKTHTSRCEIKKIDYKKLFSVDNLGLYIKHIDIQIDKIDIIFLGQSVRGDDQIRDSENRLIKEIANILPDCIVYVKPHPRDIEPEKYFKSENVLLADKQLGMLPIEAFIHNIRPRCIVSLYSSATVTIANMFSEIDVILGCGVCDISAPQLVIQMRQFADYNDNMHIPDTLDELKDSLLYLSGHR